MNQDNYHIDKIFSQQGEVSAELLLKYANNELTDAEAHQVEMLLVDSEFHQDAVDGMRMVTPTEFESMMSKINASIDQRVAETHEESGEVIDFQPDVQPTATKAKPRSFYRMFSIAASIILLAVAGYFFLRPNLTASDVADMNFEVFEGNIVRGGGSVSDASVYERAKKFYAEKKYEQAAPLFDQVDSIQARYCSANSYYVLGKYDLAAERFREVIRMGDGYAEDAEFGLAMTQLKQNKVDDARKVLEEMSKDERHNYHLKAKAALDQIGQL
jgi:TolA-binding protein